MYRWAAAVLLVWCVGTSCRRFERERVAAESPQEPLFDPKDALIFYGQIYRAPGLIDDPVYPWEEGDQGVQFHVDGKKLWVKGRVETPAQKAFAGAVLADFYPDCIVYNNIYVGAISYHDLAANIPTRYFNSEHADLVLAAKTAIERAALPGETFAHAYEGRLVVVTSVPAGGFPPALVHDLETLPGLTHMTPIMHVP